jgi:ABC-type branched-subunit amino acid transport system ATPase component
MSAILEVRGVTMRFGGLVANEDVNLAIEAGEIFAVIGPNGAGKTTLFNAITGIYEPTAGSILLEGRPVRREWTRGTLAAAFGTGALSAVLAVLGVNASVLWERTIIANYVYAQPFPWGEALASLVRAAGDLGWLAGVLPAVLGAAVGVAGYAAVFRATRRTPDLVARAGIARTFQNIRLFGEMNLVENVLVGMDQHFHCGFWACLLRPPAFWRERRTMRRRAYDLLRLVELERSAAELARNLPYGHQRRLEIARALATRPRLILLDEPAAGMNPSESAELMALIRRIRDSGVTVVLIEHDMKVVMGISDRVAVLQYGRKIAEGTPEAIRNDPVCIEAYLGTEAVE